MKRGLAVVFSNSAGRRGNTATEEEQGPAGNDAASIARAHRTYPDTDLRQDLLKGMHQVMKERSYGFGEVGEVVPFVTTEMVVYKGGKFHKLLKAGRDF